MIIRNCGGALLRIRFYNLAIDRVQGAVLSRSFVRFFACALVRMNANNNRHPVLAPLRF